MRRLLIILATLPALLIALAPPVAADPLQVHESARQTFASAFTENCGPDACEFEGVFGGIIRPRSGKAFSVVCYDRASFGPRGESFVGGCTEGARVAIDRKFGWASLGPATIELHSCTETGCTPAGTVTVSATLTATGPARRFTHSSVDRDGGCVRRFSDRGVRREAAGSYTVNGTTTAARGDIRRSMHRFTSTCPEG